MSYPKKPHEGYEPPGEPLREEAKRLEEELGVEWAYPGAGGSSVNPNAPLNPFAGESVPPMREWKPFIPQALVHSEFERLERAIAHIKYEGFPEGQQPPFSDKVTVDRFELGIVIGQTERLIARYKELWDIASGIVNSENLKGEEL